MLNFSNRPSHLYDAQSATFIKELGVKVSRILGREHHTLIVKDQGANILAIDLKSGQTKTIAEAIDECSYESGILTTTQEDRNSARNSTLLKFSSFLPTRP